MGQQVRLVRNESRALREEAAKSKLLIDQLNSAAAEQKARIDGVVAEQQKQFSEAQERRLTRFGEIESELLTKVQSRLKGIEEESEAMGAELGKNAEGLLSRLENQLQEADRIVGVISETGLIGGYKRVADRHSWIAHVLQGLAGFAFIGVVWLALTTLSVLQPSGVTAGTAISMIPWPLQLMRITAIGALGIAGAYFASPGEKYRESERWNRQRAARNCCD